MLLDDIVVVQEETLLPVRFRAHVLWLLDLIPAAGSKRADDADDAAG